MSDAAPLLFFDLADPLSYLLELELRAAEKDAGVEVERVPLELCPPPRQLLDPQGPDWRNRLEEARRHTDALGVELRAPTLLPWTRKAHELLLHARASGAEADVLLALYRALFTDGKDIGRVDVLVAVATSHGLDRTESKAVLDVDRFAADVVRGAERARQAGVTAPPAILAGDRRLEGFHNRDAIGTLLLPDRR